MSESHHAVSFAVVQAHFYVPDSVVTGKSSQFAEDLNIVDVEAEVSIKDAPHLIALQHSEEGAGEGRFPHSIETFFVDDGGVIYELCDTSMEVSLLTWDKDALSIATQEGMKAQFEFDHGMQPDSYVACGMDKLASSMEELSAATLLLLAKKAGESLANSGVCFERRLGSFVRPVKNVGLYYHLTNQKRGLALTPALRSTRWMLDSHSFCWFGLQEILASELNALDVFAKKAIEIYKVVSRQPNLNYQINEGWFFVEALAKVNASLYPFDRESEHPGYQQNSLVYRINTHKGDLLSLARLVASAPNEINVKRLSELLALYDEARKFDLHKEAQSLLSKPDS